MLGTSRRTEVAWLFEVSERPLSTRVDYKAGRWPGRAVID